MNASPSEDHGLALLGDDDLRIYSVGISTGGQAEIRMAKMSPKRHVIATTIDEEGVRFATECIIQEKLGGRLEARIEDVSKPLPHPSGSFDFVYARLVLHYLTGGQLESALGELWRILKPDGRLFIVVRSDSCPDARREGTTLDPVTHLTSGVVTNEKTGRTYSYVRYFHSEQSISEHVTRAGFVVQYVERFDEHLYTDFMRTELSPHMDNVIELLARKQE